MQTTYTELSLESNEALSLASVVRQSCPTARLRGDADPEPHAVARVRTPAFCLRLARMAHMARSRGVLAGAATHCRETHVRLASDGGEAHEMLLLHGTGDKAAGAR